MQEEDFIERINDKCHVYLYCSMQEEDLIELTNVKCRLLYTLVDL
jgi:hypothetical protein